MSLPDTFLRRIDVSQRKKMGKAGLTADECAIIAAAKSEKHLQQQLVGLLRRNDIIPIRQRMDKKSNIDEGLPDIFFAVGREGFGIPVAWEAKMPGEKPTAEQTKKHAELRATGWTVKVIWTYAEGLQHLRELQARNQPPTGIWPIVNQ